MKTKPLKTRCCWRIPRCACCNDNRIYFSWHAPLWTRNNRTCRRRTSASGLRHKRAASYSCRGRVGNALFLHGLVHDHRRCCECGLIKWMSIKVLDITQGNLFGNFNSYIMVLGLCIGLYWQYSLRCHHEPAGHWYGKQLWRCDRYWPSSSPRSHAIWWSLALGACLGGNGTMIGASANVVVCVWLRKLGKPISFKKFML